MKQIVDRKTYTQVYKVIKQKKEFQEKLPQNLIKDIEKMMDKTNEDFTYDESKDIFSQIDRNALAICTYLYTKYIATDEEKNNIKKILIKNEIEYKKIGGENCGK